MTDKVKDTSDMDMEEINESDEVVLDEEYKVKDPSGKLKKIQKNLIREERKIFDSGDHYMQEDEVKRMQQQAEKELEHQSIEMEQKVSPSQKKSLMGINNKPVAVVYSPGHCFWFCWTL